MSFEPKLLTVIREGYTREMFLKDVGAGLIVGVVALPLAIAFAIASGVKPEQGLITAVVAGFIISLLSGSRVQIGGPTGAFIILVYSVVQQHGYAGLALATLMAGIILVLLGIARFGTILRFIPYPVTVGFTAGIAVVIVSSQVRDVFGLTMSSVPAHVAGQVSAYAGAFSTVNPYAVLITLITVVIMLLLPKLFAKIPSPLIALLVTTSLVHVFSIPVATIGSRFGAVPSGIPTLSLPTIDWSAFSSLISPAVSIALLAGIESLLSAVVADGMTGRKHRSNMELVAQGVANIVTPFFGGIPATGAIARTATNIKSGGKTPIAGIVHAITLLIILVVAGRWAVLIPMPTLAGILLVVAYNMSEMHLFANIARSSKSDAIVLLTTFFLTVLADLTVAIQVGVVLAAFLFMKRMADVAQVRALTNLTEDEAEVSVDADEYDAIRSAPKGVEIFEVDGPFFFGAAQKFKSALSDIQRKPRVLILRMRHVLALDSTGLRVLEEMQTDAEHGRGPVLILSAIHTQPVVILERSGFLKRLGQENVAADLVDAIERARAIVGSGTDVKS
ncbi:MAG: STAS domain-containing protein [Ignavibacteria bacterium]|nr:STAS domain-containing protein [Ignavibacteria bacterium]